MRELDCTKKKRRKKKKKEKKKRAIKKKKCTTDFQQTRTNLCSSDRAPLSRPTLTSLAQPVCTTLARCILLPYLCPVLSSTVHLLPALACFIYFYCFHVLVFIQYSSSILPFVVRARECIKTSIINNHSWHFFFQLLYCCAVWSPGHRLRQT